MLSEEQDLVVEDGDGHNWVSMLLLRHRSYLTAYRDGIATPTSSTSCHAQPNDPAFVRGPAFVADTDLVHPAYTRGLRLIEEIRYLY